MSGWTAAEIKAREAQEAEAKRLKPNVPSVPEERHTYVFYAVCDPQLDGPVLRLERSDHFAQTVRESAYACVVLGTGAASSHASASKAFLGKTMLSLFAFIKDDKSSKPK
jgi:hypothetical protein